MKFNKLYESIMNEGKGIETSAEVLFTRGFNDLKLWKSSGTEVPEEVREWDLDPKRVNKDFIYDFKHAKGISKDFKLTSLVPDRTFQKYKFYMEYNGKETDEQKVAQMSEDFIYNLLTKAGQMRQEYTWSIFGDLNHRNWRHPDIEVDIES
jgi:hypothetical protein